MAKSTLRVVPIMTVAEAARKLHVTPQSVYRWIDDGTLERYAAIEGNTILVVAASVDALMKKRQEVQS